MTEEELAAWEAMSPLERVAKAMQDFVNSIDAEAPVLLRGGVVAWESMVLNEDGDTGFKVSYAALPNTSMSSTVGLLEMGRNAALLDMSDGPCTCGEDDD